MKLENLRSLIRESINEYINKIDEEGNTAMYAAKKAACEEAIRVREEKLTRIDESEDLKELVHPEKIKEIKREIEDLKKYKGKVEKLEEKARNKGKKKEVTTDAETDKEEKAIDESDVTAEMDMGDGDDAKEKALNESFLKMQKLAGVITEAQYNQKKILIENQLEEISLSGALGKVKDKIVNSSIFNKLIDTIVSKMSEKDKENFKTKFALSEAEGGPSLEDIMSKVDAANPDKNVKNPEELKEELNKNTLEGKIVDLVRNLTGINLLALGGAPLGLLINSLLGISTWGMGAFIGPVISLVASLIIHGISRKLLGLTSDDAVVGS